ncbi:MAG: DUF11 domain-containing protein, partial [Deltaproteobacteria bacterium]|nr:DUF11 domain-containing protein [Deltaproteobacteria bacterium]
RPGVFLVYETNPEFSYQDAYIYTFGTGGEMVRTLVDTGEYAAISVYGQYIGEVGDDGSFLAWMSNDPFGYPLPLTAVALVPDGNEPSGYRAVPLSVTGVTDQAPPAIRTSTGCWSLPMQTVQTGENSGLNGIDPTNPNPFRLWGCPLASDGPAESLASWNVIYRSDAKPRIGFQARVDRVCQLEIANTATISTTSAQVSTDNDTSTARVNVATADLAVTVTTPMTVVRQDEPELTVTVGIENRGPMAAKDVVVNLALPAGIALGMGGQTQWTLPSLAANTSTQFQVPVVVTNLDADVTLRLTGNASSASLDCTPDNDSVTLSLLVGTWADIRVTKTGPATVRVFEPFTWQVGWQNLGNDSTQPFVVNDELPLDDNLQVAVELLSIGSADDLDTVLQWPDQVLDVSQANNDEILAVVSDCSMVGKTLVNRAIATYPDDANPSDNEASTSTVVTGPLASLAAIVTGPDSALAGQSTTFSANVESTGSDKARSGVLTITVDNGTIPTSTVGTPMGNTLIVPLYDLAPDALSNVNFEVVSNIAYTITATVSGDNVCPPPVVLKNVGMDTPECTFDFDCAPAMDSCHEARCVDFVCVEVPLTGNFCEDGNACTTGDTCMDGVCQGGSDGLCDDFNACTDDVCDPMMGCSNTTITCDDGFDCTMDSCDIATGCTYMPNDGDCGDGAACTTDRCDPQDIDSDTRGCVSQPDNAGCDDFDNCTMDYCGGPMAGTADGCVHDEIPGCRVTTTNVVITKTPDLQSMQVRGQVTWTLTAQNFGTLTATNVVVSDWLPVGMNYVSAAPVPTTNSGSFYFWNVGDLAPGGTFSVTFTATAGCDVFQGAMGGTTSTTVTNTAYVTADNDPDDLDYVTDGDTDEAQVEVYRILGNDTCNGFDDDCDGIDGNDDTCDDGNDCTDDVCANGACQHNGNANACDDGDNCTTNDLCQNTECQGSTVNCDDGIPCTADYCDPATGMCQHDPMGGFCNDGLDCTMDSCSPFDPRADFNGCVYAADDMACDDGFSCTSDHCQPGVGCVAEPNDLNCGPGNDCTTNSCNPSAPEAGADGCVAAINDMVCNDGIDCTNDSCDPQMGCQHVTDDTACMNGGECRTGTCDATMGCVYTPEPERCDDGNACTTDTCDEATGACMNAEIGCDDNSLCTMDSCDPTFGCRYEPIACDDFNACTSDSCDDTMGCVNETLDCGDDNACTSDSCNPATGCEYEPVTCNDFNACTSDSCNPAEGCTYATITCNGDACNAGSCDPTMGCQLTPIDCDDNNACTNDVCNPIMGCLYTQVSCNDGDACTDDVCDREMGCTTVESSCDDNNPCTTDSCDPVLGCQHAEVTCDDFNACTSDACDPVQGCVYTTLSCDDGDFCTDDSCDVATGCAHEQVPPVEVECGAGACGGVTQGLSQCIDNAWVDNCEEVPTGTIPDTGCSPKRVAYAIVNDENGEPYGTIRCFQDLTTFAVSCETVPGTSELKVYDAFFCGLNDEVTK